MSKFQVCPICEGEGAYVNPAVDSQGIAPQEFADDPEFAEAYFAGRYDVACQACGGRRVITAGELRDYRERLADFATTMQEAGAFYCDSRL